jgi:hypothetical protein
MTIGALRSTEVMQMQLQQRPSGLRDWLYVAIVAALGLYFVIGVIAWTMFIYDGIAVPDSFATILAHHRGWAGRRARAHRWSRSVLAAQPGTTATGGVMRGVTGSAPMTGQAGR